MTSSASRDNPVSDQVGAETGIWIRNLVDIEVIVIAEPGSDLRMLMHELHALKMRVRHIWPAPAILPQATDILVCGYLDNLTQRLGWMPGSPPVALVLLVPDSPHDIDVVINATPDSILSPPFTPNAVRASMAHALNQFRYGRRIRNKIERLEESIHSIRTVERAKSILMERKNLTEAEAYSEIRKIAMNKRVPVATIATVIVDSLELLGSIDL